MKQVNTAVSLIADWATVAALLFSGFGWIMLQIPTISDWSWAAIALASIFMTATLMAVGSLILAAWRFFNPLPQGPIAKAAEEVRRFSTNVHSRGVGPRGELAAARVAIPRHELDDLIAKRIPKIETKSATSSATVTVEFSPAGALVVRVAQQS